MTRSGRRSTADSRSTLPPNSSAPMVRAHLNLGLLYAAQRRPHEAEAALRAALEVDPRFAPASVNLADLYRATGRDAEGERVLRGALEKDTRSAAGASWPRPLAGTAEAHGRGLAGAGSGGAPGARERPLRIRVRGRARRDRGGRNRRSEVLERVLARHPNDRDTLSALVAYEREQNRPRQALVHARRLADIEADERRGAPARRAARGRGPTLRHTAVALYRR